MSSLQVDPDALRSTKPGFAAAAAKVLEAARNVQSTVEAEGECWGNDEIGENFAKEYTPGAEDGMKGIEGLSKAVDALSTGVDAIASAFENQDELNSTAIDKIKSTIE
ncbi:hypothetical protein IU433_16685 [Nocardia puris]|uniref:Excreted virulence factor EspC (Type VII ESX diderm) n=1 Tax=Nocardia puris TaxID=208602 RepID=A0A366DA19_9NOCA|nr:hypothetical protein [Nocardia puris]MBF6211682.1 hypothetical protein [Nocardia puris]MBF6365686.1 hypothetical protein [Nocardia puris]MBF6460672.1 hypothetical protein [Nocardia puris]RBO86856.1 hypothetical protein DFR74_11228 [Nocardia puris]